MVVPPIIQVMDVHFNIEKYGDLGIQSILFLKPAFILIPMKNGYNGYNYIYRYINIYVYIYIISQCCPFIYSHYNPPIMVYNPQKWVIYSHDAPHWKRLKSLNGPMPSEKMVAS